VESDASPPGSGRRRSGWSTPTAAGAAAIGGAGVGGVLPGRRTADCGAGTQRAALFRRDGTHRVVFGGHCRWWSRPGDGCAGGTRRARGVAWVTAAVSAGAMVVSLVPVRDGLRTASEEGVRVSLARISRARVPGRWRKQSPTSAPTGPGMLGGWMCGGSLRLPGRVAGSIRRSCSSTAAGGITAAGAAACFRNGWPAAGTWSLTSTIGSHAHQPELAARHRRRQVRGRVGQSPCRRLRGGP
jgi:hypothetical protein